MHDPHGHGPSESGTPEHDGPLVTVGMPIWNGVPHVSEALGSIVRQSYPNLEIIVSDDCSTDATYAICEGFAREDPRITLVRQPRNLGMWANFQYVLDRAHGRYFMWASQDDVWDRDWVKCNLGALAPGEIVSFGSFCTIDIRGERVHAFPEKSYSRHRLARSLQVMYSHMTGVLMYGLYDLDLLRQVPGFVQLSGTGLFADNLFMLLAANAGEFRSSRGSVLLKRLPVDGSAETPQRSVTARKIARVFRDTAHYCGYYLKLDLSPDMRAMLLLNTLPFYVFLLLSQWRGTVYSRRNVRRRPEETASAPHS